MKKVSIIVPIYNSQQYLSSLLDCLANQTYSKKHLEVILVNDGSTDISENICKEYCNKNKNFHLISKTNGGISSARNAGLNVATGHYVTFLDSDDTCSLQYVEKMVEAFEKYNSQLVCCGIIEKYDSKTNEYGYKKNKNFSIKNEKAYVDFFNDYWLPVVWNKLYIKKLITEKFDETISYDEDTVFNLNYLKNVKSITCIKEKLYTYYIRQNSNSLSKQGMNQIFEKSKVTNKFRLNLSKQIFKSKKAVYVACRKIIKAIFQEVQQNYNNKMQKSKILKIAKERLKDQEVLNSFLYFSKIFDQDVVIKDIITNNDLEKLYDCAINGFDKYLTQKINVK